MGRTCRVVVDSSFKRAFCIHRLGHTHSRASTSHEHLAASTLLQAPRIVSESIGIIIIRSSRLSSLITNIGISLAKCLNVSVPPLSCNSSPSLAVAEHVLSRSLSPCTAPSKVSQLALHKYHFDSRSFVCLDQASTSGKSRLAFRHRSHYYCTQAWHESDSLRPTSSFTQKKASSYNLTGWVKNTPDDKVGL